MSGGAELERVANLRVRCATTVPSINLPLVDRVRAPAGMFSGLLGRALSLSSKNSSSLLSISSHVSSKFASVAAFETRWPKVHTNLDETVPFLLFPIFL